MYYLKIKLTHHNPDPTLFHGRHWFQCKDKDDYVFNVIGNTYKYWDGNLRVYDGEGNVVFQGQDIQLEENKNEEKQI